MWRFIIGFFSGITCAIAGALVFGLVQTGRVLNEPPRKIEGVVTIHVNEDPSQLVPHGDVAPFLKNALRLDEAQAQSILAASDAGVLTELRIRIDRQIDGAASQREISVALQGRKFGHLLHSTNLELKMKWDQP